MEWLSEDEQYAPVLFGIFQELDTGRAVFDFWFPWNVRMSPCFRSIFESAGMRRIMDLFQLGMMDWS